MIHSGLREGLQLWQTTNFEDLSEQGMFTSEQLKIYPVNLEHSYQLLLRLEQIPKPSCK